MAISTLIQQRGFRKWYERELIRSHSHLVLLILCALAVVGALEALSGRTLVDRLLLAACLVVAAAIGAWAMRRYLFFLMRAEAIANQAVCPACSVYARWTVERDEAADALAGTPPVMAVCCRACSHRWRIAC